MVVLVRLGQPGEEAGGRPVEVAAVDDEAAEDGAVAADELGGGVDDYVGPMLYRTDEIRGAEGVVDHEGYLMRVGDGGDGLDVDDVAVGVAHALDVDKAGLRADSRLKILAFAALDERRVYAAVGEGVGEEVEGAAVERGCGDDVAALGEYVLHGAGYRGGAAGERHGGDAALERGHALLKHRGGGVVHAGVDIAGLAEVKSRRGLGAGREHI